MRVSSCEHVKNHDSLGCKCVGRVSAKSRDKSIYINTSTDQHVLYIHVCMYTCMYIYMHTTQPRRLCYVYIHVHVEEVCYKQNEFYKSLSGLR